MTAAFEQGSLEIIRHVFEQVGFPFFRIDLVALAEALVNPRIEEGTHFHVELTTKTERYPTFISAMRGILQTIEVPPQFAALFADSPVLHDEMPARSRLRQLISDPIAPFAIAEHNGGLYWKEGTPWPLAYRSYLQQLIGLISFYQALLLDRKKSLAKQYEAAGYSADSIDVLDQTSRVLPTKQHYAAASFGSWLGGAQNWQYLSLFATGPQLRDSAINLQYLKQILYSDTDAQQLDAGGLVAVPASVAAPLLNVQDSSVPVLGGTSIDENNLANPSAIGMLSLPVPGEEILHPGFLVDKQYRSVFFARPLESQAIYGASDVFRDHYSSFYKHLKLVDTLRCKHYCVPVVEVSSISELRELVSAIPRYCEEGVFFRGQSSFYPLVRTERVRRLLFGSSRFIEPSLSTSAARNRFDYDSLHFALRYFLEYYVLETGRKRRTGEERTRYERWSLESNSPLCEIDYAVMALSQHYGLPSHGLDVTDDLEIAAWFATNLLGRNGSTATYTPMVPEQWGTDSKKWPVVFALQRITHSLGMSIQKCRELEAFGLPALRPQRQAASFYLGGHSDHQNRLAESLVCAFRLKPGTYDTTCDFSTLFPSPEEDPAYAAMLRFQEFPQFATLAGGKVTRFHPTT